MFENKNILITGASYGLGAFIAESLGKMGANIILVARNVNKLQYTFSKLPKNSKNLVIPCDLEANDEINEMCEKVKNHFQHLDIIMHVAGGGFGVKDALPV